MQKTASSTIIFFVDAKIILLCFLNFENIQLIEIRRQKLPFRIYEKNLASNRQENGVKTIYSLDL